SPFYCLFVLTTPAPTELYTLSLHDALPIYGQKIGTSSLWPGFQMCHNAPAYRKYYIDRVTRISPNISLFTQDNINMPSFQGWGKDRKSTRLNSSHVKISYAVFCLKKKKKKI